MRSLCFLMLILASPVAAIELFRSTAQVAEQSAVIVHARLIYQESQASNPYLRLLEFESLEVFRGNVPARFSLSLFTGAKQLTAGFPLYEGSELLLFLNPVNQRYELVSPEMGWNPVVLNDSGRILVRPISGYPSLEGRVVRLEDLRNVLPR